MSARELLISGVFEFTPQVFTDDRGQFTSPFQAADFAGVVGHGFFPLAQASCSRSRKGVVRGVHYTRTPPGVAKFVFCPQGRALDIVVDLRVGSPTFGRHDTVVLDPREARAVYFPVGVGHAFVALEDDTAMQYLLSREYVPEDELAVSVLDPALALPLPADLDPVLSARDTEAIGLAQARERGLLPLYDDAIAAEKAIGPLPE
ncbi:dTDP-4-dehydrorhamnose 3,5-epimerase family protein [Streptomyces boncukensis]|uniref:dTDP-4-keto-6-deoxy-D-glucose epimerase n=1 Tax=Streptomyces boncukensis TaxID=2711219 RepID=A0A6G4X647_9ACTN|nr:dTDP-4-dehydrorhamnose 3,5-epimerase family protein [Streptomyces boncukensis]NGO72340.1 dTDP-4-keto-6-deoxy-D-glucose epimerase [Streptomyces boncukensis]